MDVDALTRECGGDPARPGPGQRHRGDGAGAAAHPGRRDAGRARQPGLLSDVPGGHRRRPAAGRSTSWAAASGTGPTSAPRWPRSWRRTARSKTSRWNRSSPPSAGGRWCSMPAGCPHEHGGTSRLLLAIEDRTEVKRAEEGRAAVLALEHSARERAEAADHLKDQFVATVSHELRGPLTAIVGWAHILSEAGASLDEATLAKGLAAITRSVTSQDRLIADLLDHSRVVTGHLQLSRRPLALFAVAEAAHRERARGGGGEGHRAGPHGRPRGQRDPGRSRPHAAGALEPVLQRGEVHSAPGAHPDLDGPGGYPGPPHRERHRPGDSQGLPAPRVRALPPAGRHSGPRPRGPRAGPDPRARAGRAARGNGPRGQPRGRAKAPPSRSSFPSPPCCCTRREGRRRWSRMPWPP